VKNTLKFLGIGFALVLLVVSQQVGMGQPVEGAVATLSEDTVKWLSDGDGAAGSANAETAGTAVKYYAAGANAGVTEDVAHFFIQDSTLNATQSGKTIYVPILAGVWGGETAITVENDELIKLGEDRSNCLGDTGLVCHETNALYAGAEADGTNAAGADGTGGGATPLVGGSLRLYKGTMTVGGTSYDEVALGVSYDGVTGFDNVDEQNGTFHLITDVAADADGSTTLVATYDFHMADNRTVAQKVAKVTTTSDSNGEWVKIEEVNAIGGEIKATNSKYFVGKVAFDTNASAGASGTTCSRTQTTVSTAASEAADLPCVWAKDGDTVTVTYYASAVDSNSNGTIEDSEVGAVIATSTATIDASVPTITNITPADGTLTNDTSPQLSFTISDTGVGFDADLADYGDHITLSVNDKVILDTEISVSAHSTSSITYTFDLAGAVEFDATASGTRTTGEGFTISDSSGPASQAANDRKIHGGAFNWTIVAIDDIGNSKTLDNDDLNLHIDSVAPAYASNALALAWDAVLLTNTVVNKKSVSITMTESVNTSTVETTDFVVSGVGVATGTTIDSVSFGGNDGNQNTIIYLNLSADLAPNAIPKIEFQGEISDLAGNVLKVASSDSDGKITWDEEATDNISPTISSVVVADTYLDDTDTTTITFTSDEPLTGAGTIVTEDSCTCAYIYGPVSNMSGMVQAITAGGDSSLLHLTLTTETTGTADIKEGNAPFAGTTALFGVQITGKDVSGKYGYGGITKVTGEDISNDIVGAWANDADYDDKIKINNWPLADHDGDGELDDSITKITVNGTVLGTVIVREIDWGTDETINLRWEATDDSLAIAAADVVKIDYWYINAANVVQVDQSGPDVKVTPSNDGTTEDLRARITIDWSQNSDAGTPEDEGEDEYGFDSHKTVTVTIAELTDPAGVMTDIKGSLITSDNVSFYYKPTSDLSLGQYSLKLKGEDENANASAETTIKFTVNEKSKTTIAMEAGWNLISLPANPSDPAINSVITNNEVTTVLTYDPAVAGGWLTAVRDAGVLTGTLTTMDATRAYWVYQEDGDDIKTLIPATSAGVQSVPPAINVVKGWNLLPVASMNNSTGNVFADTYLANLDWVKAKGWNASTELWVDVVSDTGDGNLGDGDTMTIGKGYWVFANKAGTLIP